MRIYTSITIDIASGRVIDAQCHEYEGPIALCCGASSQQSASYNTQAGITQQIMQQGQQVFGNSSQIFNDLVSSLAPTVKAGPDQQGFSPSELSNLESSAVTQSGIAARNAKAATGDAIAAEGGGNTSTTSGANIGIQEGVETSAAENEADELNKINEADYATGRQNYNEAVSSLSKAPSVFDASTSLDNAADNAAANQANTANQLASQNNSWVQAVTGALGSVAGAATTGGMNMIGKNMGKR